MEQDKLNPIHPGEVLFEEFLKPMGLTREQVASDISISISQLDKIIAEQAGINADMALRLARYFGTSPRFWTGLQADYDLDVTSEFLGDRLEQEVRIRAVAGGEDVFTHQPSQHCEKFHDMAGRSLACTSGTFDTYSSTGSIPFVTPTPRFNRTSLHPIWTCVC